MARSVTFNGITQFRPGGLTKIEAGALAQVGLSTNGVVGVIGEADGGTSQPGEVVTLDDPALAKEYFRSGPLADAVGILFDPSDDPRVPGGVTRVYAVRPNAATRGSVVLYNKVAAATTIVGSTAISIKFAALTFTVDEHNGNIIRIGTYAGGVWSNFEEHVVTDTLADEIQVAAPGFTSIPGTGVSVALFAPMVTIYSKEYGSVANGIKQEYEPGGTSGQSWTTSFADGTQVSEDIGGKAVFQLEYNGQKAAGIPSSGVATAGAASSLTDSTKAWTINAFTNWFIYADDAGALAVDNLRKISANTATQVTVTNAFTATPDTSTNYEIRKGKIYSDLLTAAGSGSTLTLPATVDIPANEFATMVVAITTGVAAGAKRAITSNTAGASSVLTLDYAWETGKVPAIGDAFEIRYVTSALATIAGDTGVAKTLEVLVAKDGAAAASDLSVTFTEGQTLRELINLINSNTDYLAYIPNGVNADTTLVSSFDFDLGATSVTIQNDRNAVLTPPSNSQMVPVPWPSNFRKDLQALVDDINARAAYVTAARSAGASTGAGSGRPEYTGGGIGTIADSFKYLTGGARGISANSDWQAAFDTLLQYRCNHVVPLISQDLINEGFSSTASFASVAAQLASHLGLANGASKTERGGYIGMKGTFSQLTSQANIFNNSNVQLTGQRIKTLDVGGSLKEMDEWSTACVAVGMRSGVPEIGEPLTWKYFRATGVYQDASWDPADRTDANTLIQNGILFSETLQNKGNRWVRDLTTYVQDDNLAYMEGSVADELRHIAYGLRTYLEDIYTGVKAKPANVSSIKESTLSYLEQKRGENILVDSIDVAGNLLYAYRNIRVRISGDIASIYVIVTPAVGINFQLTTINLQLPVLSS